MKPKSCLFLLLFTLWVLSGCVPTTSITMTTQTQQPASTSTISPTDILAAQPTPTITPTQLATLEPDQAREKIRLMMQDAVDCDAPCFWGIKPSQTSVSDAVAIFAHLGLQVNSTELDKKEFYGIAYELDSKFSFRVILTSQENIINNIRVKITPGLYQASVPREWAAFSPDALIKRYGPPSKVEIAVDEGSEHPDFEMVLYFDAQDLIVSYFGYDLAKKFQICPLTEQFDLVSVWMGREPQNPPGKYTPLEQATYLKMEAFTNLMTGDPEQACFKLNFDAFQQ